MAGEDYFGSCNLITSRVNPEICRKEKPSMPAASENFSATGLGSGDILLRMVGAFERLGWTLKYAEPRPGGGYTPAASPVTPRKWILLREKENLVTSRMIYNEALTCLSET